MRFLSRDHRERSARVHTRVNSRLPCHNPDQLCRSWSIITIDNGTTPVIEGTQATAITDIVPGFFTVDGRQNGVAAASAVRVLPDGKQQPVVVFSCKGADHASPRQSICAAALSFESLLDGI